MAEVKKSVVTLRVGGDDLVPEEITSLLGASPTHAHIKGAQGIGPKVGDVRVARSGMWTLEAPDRAPENMDSQIREILNQTTSDLAVWLGITKRYRVDLFCGLFLNGIDGGLSLSPESLAALGERGIELGLCIYGEDDEEHETRT